MISRPPIRTLAACLTLLLALAHTRALAAEGAAAGVQGSSGAPAGSAGITSTEVVAECELPSSPRLADRAPPAQAGAATRGVVAPRPVSVTVNAATAWQPRGGTVLVAIQGDPSALVGLTVKACFGWSTAQAKAYFTPENLRKLGWEGFVAVRPTEQNQIMNIGVVIPTALESAPSNVFQRWIHDDRSTGSGLVPVVDMRLIGYTKDGILFDEVRPVGVTNVLVALIISAGALVLALIGLHRLAAGPPATTGSVGLAHRVSGWLRALWSPNWILDLIQMPDGRASLSAFQILLWTLVVAISAIYVMVLSGNLINLTPGTLTLLGIAGAAGLIASFSDASPSGKIAAGGTATTVVREVGATGNAASGSGGAAANDASVGARPSDGGAAAENGVAGTPSGAAGGSATNDGTTGGGTGSGAATGGDATSSGAASRGESAATSPDSTGAASATDTGETGQAGAGTSSGSIGAGAAVLGSTTSAATGPGANDLGAAGDPVASGGTGTGPAGVGAFVADRAGSGGAGTGASSPGASGPGPTIAGPSPTNAGSTSTTSVTVATVVVTPLSVPSWRDLILDPDTKTPDISRTQMLLFTVVSAAFVVMQVLNYYVIPDIPAGYQILIGISNGVYVGRKFKTAS